MAIRLTVTTLGMLIGAALIGIAINDKVKQSWEVLTGSKVTG